MNGRQIYDGEVSEEQLNKLYNAANVNISTTVGEGFGLSLLESQATGTRSIAPKHSSIPEVLNGTGHLLPNKAVWFPQNDNGFSRPIIDAYELTKALEWEYLSWKESGKEKVINQDCLDNVQANFLWEDKREFLLKIFKEVLSND